MKRLVYFRFFHLSVAPISLICIHFNGVPVYDYVSKAIEKNSPSMMLRFFSSFRQNIHALKVPIGGVMTSKLMLVLIDYPKKKRWLLYGVFSLFHEDQQVFVM